MTGTAVLVPGCYTVFHIFQVKANQSVISISSTFIVMILKSITDNSQ